MNQPQSKVELRLSCANLACSDWTSKSDPQVIVSMRPISVGPAWLPSSGAASESTWQEVGRTETITNNQNPEFATPINLDYFFEIEQKLRFQVYDIDKPNGKLEDQEYLGYAEATLAEIVSARNGNRELPLINPKKTNGAKIKIRAQELQDNKQSITFEFQGRKLDKKDMFGKSDPFYTISRPNPDNTSTLVHKSEIIKKELNPDWARGTLHLGSLCNGDTNLPLLFEVYDWDNDGGHDLIGQFSVSVAELVKANGGGSFDIISPKKKGNKGYKNSGTFVVKSCALEKHYTFLDYIQSGTNINLVAAIDWTGSNGDPVNPSSLHYRNPNSYNEYQSAIMSVGSILEPYDPDRLFPVYGFGGKLPTGIVSHCFALNGNAERPEVAGVAGILEAYGAALANVTLWGPTNFSPIINEVAGHVRQQMSIVNGTGTAYTILLILTDGAITDQSDTIAAIVAASSLPMSIVVVGLGTADFSSMEVLDADKVPLQSNGRCVERDIVQFVPFRDFLGPNAYKLAHTVLAEVPAQFMTAMEKLNVKPRNV